ncbi:hypothetical protein [Streptomyces altiplanensis]
MNSVSTSSPRFHALGIGPGGTTIRLEHLFTTARTDAFLVMRRGVVVPFGSQVISPNVPVAPPVQAFCGPEGTSGGPR